MTPETKQCAHCDHPKLLAEFGYNAINLNQGARDGLNIYCKACCRLKTKDGRRVPLKSKRRPLKWLAPQFTDESQAQVLTAIRNRLHSREAIQRYTKLTMDEVGDVLAFLAFEKRKLRIVKVGNQREFHLAA